MRRRVAPPALADLNAEIMMLNGRPVTVGDYIVEQIEAGVDSFTAAAAAGVTTAELTEWIKRGTAVKNRLLTGADWDTEFTPDEQDVAVFADRAVRAASSHVARLAVAAEQVAHGGVTVEEVREKKDATGMVVERVTTTSTTLPDAGMLKFKLGVHQPQVYGPKATLRVLVTDTSDTDDVGDVFEATLLAVVEGLRRERAAEQPTEA